MGKSPPEVLALLLQKLPEGCITQLVEVYRTRTTAVATITATARKDYFLYKRDNFQHTKTRAVQQYVQWVADTYGEGMLRRMRDTGRLGYGCFATYARAHPELARACCLHEPQLRPHREDLLQGCNGSLVRAIHGGGDKARSFL